MSWLGTARLEQRLRLGTFMRLAHVRVGRLAHDALRKLVEVRVELLCQREKLGPQRPFVKRLRRAHEHCAVASTRLAIWPELVAPTERNEQLALPGSGSS